MTFTSPQRIGRDVIAVLALVCLSSCAVPLAPGYQVEKQSIAVRFVAGNPPHLAIRAQYRLANVGNAPLDSIGLGLPGEKHFGRANLRFEVDGREITPRRERGEEPESSVGESAVAETWPTTWRILFAMPWPRKTRRTLVISYDLAATAATDPRMSIGPNAFFLNDSGWFPDLLEPKALFAKDLVRPDPSDLIVEVPADFVATASGDARGSHKTGNETQFRFRLRNNDFDPFVATGAYQQQRITTADGAVVIWTFKPVPAAEAQQTAAQIAAAAKFYSQTFGPLPKSMKAVYDIELPDDDSKTNISTLEALEAFLPGVVYDWSFSPGKGFGTDFGNGISRAFGQMALRFTWFGHMITPRPEAWMLGAGLDVYSSDGQDEKDNTGLSRNDEIVSTLEDYDHERAGTTEKPITFLIPSDPEDQLGMGGDKIRLFLFALEDRCGRENVEHAIAHMVYALRGQEYGYMDLRVALEQECRQDLSSMFATWLDQKGIPADFRARYQNGNESKNTNVP